MPTASAPAATAAAASCGRVMPHIFMRVRVITMDCSGEAWWRKTFSPPPLPLTEYQETGEKPLQEISGTAPLKLPAPFIDTLCDGDNLLGQSLREVWAWLENHQRAHGGNNTR